jgi:hypothetical protein
MNRPALLACTTLAAAALAGGCGKEFDPYNRLTSLRVLAVRADKPLPATGETATLRPLVYTTKDSGPLTYTWSWCPFPGSENDGYRCRVDEQMLHQIPGSDSIPPFDLGTGETADLPNTIDPAILTAACGGMLPAQVAGLDCNNGFPVQVSLTVSDGIETVPVVVTVRLRFTPTMDLDPPIYGLDTPNTIPEIGDLTAMRPGMAALPIDESAAATLPRDIGTDIHADVDMGTAVETYPGLDNDGNPAMLNEHLFMTWFIETGTTDDHQTSFLNDTTPWDAFQKNIWTPATTKDYPADTARLYVVIHDNRGGVSWKTGLVNLSPSP